MDSVTSAPIPRLQRGHPLAANEPGGQEALRCGSRLVEIRGMLVELRTRLETINEGITGLRSPESGAKPQAPRESLIGVTADLSDLACDCNRFAQAIEANLS